jgi:hypothetical protein
MFGIGKQYQNQADGAKEPLVRADLPNARRLEIVQSGTYNNRRRRGCITKYRE